MYGKLYQALQHRGIYKKLAERLDTVPAGFPATDSGVELRLLSYLFTPEEATLAGVMSESSEPSADIAARADIDEALAARLLAGMAEKGLISAQGDADNLTYGLASRIGPVPWVGVLMSDPESRPLFEQYFQESRGISLTHAPAPRRVVPIHAAIPFDLEIQTYDQAVALIENAKALGLRDCICRLWQQSVGKPCEHPLEVCIDFSSEEGAFDDSDVCRAITKEEAIEILKYAEDEGLVHTILNSEGELPGICNCCTCACVILRGVAEFGIPTAVARSDFRCRVEEDLCDACGLCEQRCVFGAISVNGRARINYVRCVGCGLCTTVCPTDALSLERRPAGDNPPMPASYEDWLRQFSESRESQQ